ncbi:MAG: phosphotransferase [Promethearchaeota archaeon]
MESCGEGKGFLSELVRLTLTYDNASSELPSTMIVKMPMGFRGVVNSPHNFYRREIEFYKEIAPRSKIRVPEVIYSNYDLAANRYILILEDCSKYKVVNQLEGLNIEQIKQVIKSIAKFHARWWDAQELISWDWLPKPKGEYILSFVELYRNAWDFATRSEEFLAALPEGCQKIGQKIYEQMPWIINSDPDHNLTITHYDLRAENIFFDDKNTEDPIILIDWGTAIVSTGIMDIAYLLTGSVKPKLRRKIEKEIILFYMNQLEENGLKIPDFEWFWKYFLLSTLRFFYLVPLSAVELEIDPNTIELVNKTAKRMTSIILDNDAISICPS